MCLTSDGSRADYEAQSPQAVPLVSSAGSLGISISSIRFAPVEQIIKLIVSAGIMRTCAWAPLAREPKLAAARTIIRRVIQKRMEIDLGAAEQRVPVMVGPA